MKFSIEKVFGIFYVVIAAVALYCYNPFQLFFQNDDFIHIPLSIRGEVFQRNSFRPVCDLSIIIDALLFGKNAVGYHFTNLLLHIICAALVFVFSKRIAGQYFKVSDPNFLSVTVALLFLVYASHGEAVFWILGRSGILGAIFSLLFLLSYLKRDENGSSKARYAFWLLVALLTYESSFILPLVCVLFYLIDSKKNDKSNLITVFTVFVLYLFARYIVTRQIVGSYEMTNTKDGAFLSILTNYGKLLERSFIPAYSQGLYIVSGFVVFTCFLSLIYLKSHVRKPQAILFLTFLISLLPYCTLGIDAHGYEGERYLYFPVVFLSLFICSIADAAIKNLGVKLFFFTAILVMHSISLWISARDFRLAGAVNKMVIAAVKEVKGKDTLTVYKLPQAQNGALMLRDGLMEGVSWLIGTDSLPKIRVVSKRSEWSPLIATYTTVVKTLEPGSKNAIFNFTDSVLYIKR